MIELLLSVMSSGFGFLFIIGGLGVIMLLERLYPDQQLKHVPGWWQRVVVINAAQLTITIVGMLTWERVIQGYTFFHLKDYVGPPVGGLIAYLINTWIFYWWHRARHEIYYLWLLCHQVHHSPQRIEAVTSFYKHPLEIIVDSVVMTILSYPILGLSTESSIWLSGLSAFGEYFYHMNIKTPRWIGYIFQRPESHRIHHMRNKRSSCKNYSDLPLWDMLGGTFVNPEHTDTPTGFLPQEEARLKEMIMFKDVRKRTQFSSEREVDRGSTSQASSRHKIRPGQIGYTLLLVLIICIGSLQSVGYLFGSPVLRGIGIASVSSPLPLVFSSYNGVETFSTTFVLNITTFDNRTIITPMTHEIYSQIDGPYNRRNVYGVIFSHGPFFTTQKLIDLRQRILNYGICEGNLYLNVPGRDVVTKDIKELLVMVRSKTKGNEGKSWTMSVRC